MQVPNGYPWHVRQPEQSLSVQHWLQLALFAQYLNPSPQSQAPPTQVPESPQMVPSGFGLHLPDLHFLHGPHGFLHFFFFASVAGAPRRLPRAESAVPAKTPITLRRERAPGITKPFAMRSNCPASMPHSPSEETHALMR
jgi:hypothetical protein